jgi:tRNA(fMet)-specific endonuclease VapC
VSLLLLDTTFLIDAERGEEALDQFIGDDDDVAIAAVTVAELLVGVTLATARHRARRQAYLDAVLAAIPVSGYDVTVALVHAELLAAVRRAGRPRGAHDLIIAATARATKRTVVTADLSAFEGLPGVTVAAHR